MQLFYNDTLGTYAVKQYGYPFCDIELVLTRQGRHVHRTCFAADDTEATAKAWNQLAELKYATLDQIRGALENVRNQHGRRTWLYNKDKLASETRASAEQVYAVAREALVKHEESEMRIDVAKQQIYAVDSVLRGEIDVLQNRITALEATPVVSPAELDGLKKDVADLRSDWVESAKNITRIDSELEGTKDAVEQLDGDLIDAIQKITSLNTAGKGLEESYSELQTKVSDLRTELASLRSMHENHSVESKEMSEQAASMMAQMQDDRAAIEALRAENARINKAGKNKRKRDQVIISKFASILVRKQKGSANIKKLRVENAVLKRVARKERVQAKRALAKLKAVRQLLQKSEAKKTANQAHAAAADVSMKEKRKHNLYDVGEMRLRPILGNDSSDLPHSTSANTNVSLNHQVQHDRPFGSHDVTSGMHNLEANDPEYDSNATLQGDVLL